MASPSAPVHPYRYLALFLVLLIGAYLLVFLTGDKQAKPKLGIDLQGGTRVTLTARTPDGSPPSRESLNQAQEIISSRVDGLGVSGSEVVVDGDNLVITVPGNDGNEARNLGQTARLYIRPVIHAIPAGGQQPPGGTSPGGPAGAPGAPGGPGAPGLPPGMPGMPPLIAPAEPDAPVTPPRRASRPAPPRPPLAHLPPVNPRPNRGPSPRSRRQHRVRDRRQLPARRLRPHPRHQDRRASAPISRSGSRTRRPCGRAAINKFSCWPCSSRRPGATMRTCWQATTIPTCRW